ncbi:hypothetical protein F4782DRAFT_475555 [Xylaria castorea]|nr:hypothetical protein F4782DRAFT_475555 [Xylaria castorea]
MLAIHRVHSWGKGWFCAKLNSASAPSTFQFFACLAASVLGEPLFRGARQHYLSSAASRQLAILCR